jgi:hypothetical protein
LSYLFGDSIGFFEQILGAIEYKLFVASLNKQATPKEIEEVSIWHFVFLNDLGICLSLSITNLRYHILICMEDIINTNSVACISKIDDKCTFFN